MKESFQELNAQQMVSHILFRAIKCILFLKTHGWWRSFGSIEQESQSRIFHKTELECGHVKLPYNENRKPSDMKLHKR